MKCPHCNYEHGWSVEKVEAVQGNEGDFFKLKEELSRVPDEGRKLFGCPSCSKVFMGHTWE